VRKFFDDNRWIRKSAVQFKAQIAGLTQEAIIIMIFDMSVRQWPGPRRTRRTAPSQAPLTSQNRQANTSSLLEDAIAISC
tara:strand:- start:145 stop:384 length:240 start_codon:yes stop_codon:yes gene_type:complete